MTRKFLERLDLWAVGMFPILTGKYGTAEGVCVPLSLVLLHDRQACHNHSQTLHRLAERGGLSACELLAVLEDRQWKPMPEHEAWAGIFQHLLRTRWVPLSTPPRQSGKYLVGHRGHQVVMHYLDPKGQWVEGTKTGWQGKPEEFAATHWMEFEAP